MKKTATKKSKTAPKAATKKTKKPVKAVAKKLLSKPASKIPKVKGHTAKPKVQAKPAAKPTKSPAPLEASKALAKPVKGKKNAAELQIIAAPEPEAEVILTNADGKQYCRVHDCDNESTTESYCRYHYLALWKRNKVKAKILQNGKLDKYIEDLTAKYPDKYLEMLRKDLSSEKDFNLIVAEMDVEDSGDEAENEEETSRFIEEVRGGIPTPDDDEGGF
jgi:hypothetical protein